MRLTIGSSNAKAYVFSDHSQQKAVITEKNQENSKKITVFHVMFNPLVGMIQESNSRCISYFTEKAKYTHTNEKTHK